MNSRLNQRFFESINKINDAINSLFVGRYSQTLLMGTNIIFRGLRRVENLKLYFHRESALGLFTGVLGKSRGKGKGGTEYNFLFTDTFCSLRLKFWNKTLRNFIHGGLIIPNRGLRNFIDRGFINLTLALSTCSC